MYWKIIGEIPFHLHGIRVWDEVLEECGFNMAELTTSTEWGLEGYTAHYTDTPHKKVTKLVYNG